MRAIRGRLLTFLRAPAGVGDAQSYRYIEDGVVLDRRTARSKRWGRRRDLMPQLPAGHAGRSLSRISSILPGFIDPHIHYPQTQVIASYGAQLLEWLEKYTFVEEQKFADPAHAARNAEFFLDELVRNGTTTAVVYCTVHPESAEAFFAASIAATRGMIAGKVMMDRNAPAGAARRPRAAAIADSRD